MSKVAVVYWSSTGNTEAMADAVVEGAKEKGADVTLYECADFRPGTGSRLRCHRIRMPGYGR